jgi:hypothetical protein
MRSVGLLAFEFSFREGKNKKTGVRQIIDGDD